MKVLNGIIDEAEFCPSPNFNNRPKGTQVDLIVVHAISLPEGSYNTELIKDFFLNQLDPKEDEFLNSISHLQVSSHFLITRAGALIQFVPIHKRAWHAGESFFQGRKNCNDFSIGIELEGCDGDKFETDQYNSLSCLTSFLLREHNISPYNVVGHSDISPNRKTDPGPNFNWSLLRSKI
jgi:AmpD protein